MQPMLLCYHLEGEKLSKIRFVCMMLKIRFRAVAPQEEDWPVGRLAGMEIKEAAPLAEAAPWRDEMLVLCGFDDGLLNRFLNSLRGGKIPPVSLKAVLTPTNAAWSGGALCRELKREREAIQQGQAAHRAQAP